ncbi:unnamed protein product [Cyprideis torosa]|uniref:RBR-type E3 ubiquitin transferase n=1 Tax=Cyprideis torosa TaxID=163714 RepID=A0A7R8W1S4_9CRUS|nr:unnamed protein product [Cyprideis torosa]CAG0881264.1 unnamed protein product [Cyprideis torosa]
MYQLISLVWRTLIGYHTAAGGSLFEEPSSVVQIKEGSVLRMTCPEDKCLSQATPHQVKHLVSSDMYIRYEALLLSSSIETMTDMMFCPRPSCQKPSVMDENMGECPQCGFVFCRHCSRTYHGVSPCKLLAEERRQVYDLYVSGDSETRRGLELKFGKRRLEELINTYKTEGWISENTKPCPKCGTGIESTSARPYEFRPPNHTDLIMDNYHLVFGGVLDIILLVMTIIGNSFLLIQELVLTPDGMRRPRMLWVVIAGLTSDKLYMAIFTLLVIALMEYRADLRLPRFLKFISGAYVVLVTPFFVVGLIKFRRIMVRPERNVEQCIFMLTSDPWYLYESLDLFVTVVIPPCIILAVYAWIRKTEMDDIAPQARNLGNPTNPPAPVQDDTQESEASRNQMGITSESPEEQLDETDSSTGRHFPKPRSSTKKGFPQCEEIIPIYTVNVEDEAELSDDGGQSGPNPRDLIKKECSEEHSAETIPLKVTSSDGGWNRQAADNFKINQGASVTPEEQCEEIAPLNLMNIEGRAKSSESCLSSLKSQNSMENQGTSEPSEEQHEEASALDPMLKEDTSPENTLGNQREQGGSQHHGGGMRLSTSVNVQADEEIQVPELELPSPILPAQSSVFSRLVQWLRGCKPNTMMIIFLFYLFHWLLMAALKIFVLWLSIAGAPTEVRPRPRPRVVSSDFAGLGLT